MFFLIPVGVQYTARRYPVVTFTLMGLNVLVYLISVVGFWTHLQGTPEELEWQAFHLGLIPNQKTWYTFFTCMFVHGGFFHILGNMIYLFLFGSCVEDKIGRWQYSIFYVAAGLVAATTYVLATPAGPAGDIPMVGASGAINGCIGGFILLLANSKINFRWAFFFFYRLYSGDFWLPSWLVISFWFLEDAVSLVLSYGHAGRNGGVAFAAHVGGFIGGLGMIACWKLIQRKQWIGSNRLDEIDSEDSASYAGFPREMATIYLFQNGSQVGPFTNRQVAEMLALGTLSQDTFFWQDGMADWRSVAEFGHE